MSLSKVSPFYSSAPSMFTDSQPKLSTDCVPFYFDYGSHPNRFGRFTVSQIFRNGQNYSEPTFQVFKKDKCGTFEKYQQLRIGDYEFKKFLSPEERSAAWRLGDLGKIEDSTLLYTVRSGQSSFSLCPDQTVLSQREQ